MKNQNDLIISIVAIVLALIIAGVCLGTKREPATIPAPETVNLTPAALPKGDVVMASSLPAGANNSGGGFGAAGGRGAVGGGGLAMPGAAVGGAGRMGGPTGMGGKSGPPPSLQSSSGGK